MGTCCRSGDGRPCTQDECSNPRNVGAGCGAGEGLAWTLTVQLLAPKPAGLPFAEGFDAFCFFGFSAFGLRTSRLDFFWLFAMIFSFEAVVRNLGLGQEDLPSVMQI